MTFLLLSYQAEMFTRFPCLLDVRKLSDTNRVAGSCNVKGRSNRPGLSHFRLSELVQ